MGEEQSRRRRPQSHSTRGADAPRARERTETPWWAPDTETRGGGSVHRTHGLLVGRTVQRGWPRSGAPSGRAHGNVQLHNQGLGRAHIPAPGGFARRLDHGDHGAPVRSVLSKPSWPLQTAGPGGQGPRHGIHRARTTEL